MLRAQYEAGDDSDESSNGGRKRKLDDFAAGTENTTAISTDVLIKTPHFITSKLLVHLVLGVILFNSFLVLVLF